MAEPTLERGSEGPDVKDLQEALIELDFKPGAVDGMFGVYTESAVKMFQSWASLDQDGIVGPLTWEKLDLADKSDPTLKEGSKGVAVRGLQRMLLTRGFEVGEIDGRFGPKTEAPSRPSRATTGSTSTGSSARRRGTPCAKSTRTDRPGAPGRDGTRVGPLDPGPVRGGRPGRRGTLRRARASSARRRTRRAATSSCATRTATGSTCACTAPRRRGSRCGSP